MAQSAATLARAPAQPPESTTPTRRLLIHIHPLGDLDTDRERLHRLHQWLTQFPGQDTVAWLFHLPEGLYLVDFPHQRVHVCDELLQQLRTWGLSYEVASTVASAG